jgi:hypothetical protein
VLQILSEEPTDLDFRDKGTYKIPIDSTKIVLIKISSISRDNIEMFGLGGNTE